MEDCGSGSGGGVGAGAGREGAVRVGSFHCALRVEGTPRSDVPSKCSLVFCHPLPKLSYERGMSHIPSQYQSPPPTHSARSTRHSSLAHRFVTWKRLSTNVFMVTGQRNSLAAMVGFLYP